MIFKKNSILVVDDNPFNRELISHIAKEKGFKIFEASNGKEAIDKIKESNFVLVFMDMIMPIMDGYEATRKIRSMGLDIPIIAVSAMSFKQDRQKSLEAGCNDFLPKPLNTTDLEDMIEKYSKGKSKQEIDTPTVKYFVQNINFRDFPILLVEENDGLCKKYIEILKKSGFEVTRVKNGSEAFEFIKEERFKIILTNIFTPGIDGLGLLILTRRQYPQILFFIYTPKYDPDTFQLAIQQGVNGIIPQYQFEGSAIRMIEIALHQRHQEEVKQTSTSNMIKIAQDQLIGFGCDVQCKFCDIAYYSLKEAGGDMARCRHFNKEGRCGIIVADVAGHDVMSSYISAIFLGMLLTIWDKNQNPMELFKIINFELNKFGYNETHVCATAILWDRNRNKMKIATAGNPGGIFINKNPDGSLNYKEFQGGGMALGLLKTHDLFFEEEVSFDKEGFLFIFSDGIEKEQLLQIISENPSMLDKEYFCGISQKILDGVLTKEKQKDDMVLATLYIKGEATSKLHYGFLSSYEGVDKACEWFNENLAHENFPKGKDKDLILLAVRESLLNAVEHGNKYNNNAYVDLSVSFSPKELKINISDEGAGFSLNDKIKQIDTLTDIRIGSRGLPLMLLASDKVEVDGGTVSLIFNNNVEVIS
ncbi:MAG: response regulator [Desulfobacterales bacterium]|nr:response regulator [Desulfobacterales bacterium]